MALKCFVYNCEVTQVLWGFLYIILLFVNFIATMAFNNNIGTCGDELWYCVLAMAIIGGSLFGGFAILLLIDGIMKNCCYDTYFRNMNKKYSYEISFNIKTSNGTTVSNKIYNIYPSGVLIILVVLAWISISIWTCAVLFGLDSDCIDYYKENSVGMLVFPAINIAFFLLTVVLPLLWSILITMIYSCCLCICTKCFNLQVVNEPIVSKSTPIYEGAYQVNDAKV